ncbi:MAG TPA: hypothetical protein VFG63_12600 [Nocardioidaceae bacterium]|nr:hypothetical protein [Nocardioidaceae bacterium]
MSSASDTDLSTLARRGWRVLEPIHIVDYFAPETTTAYTDLGLHRRRSYFAARSAAMGKVEPRVVAATFYVFAPWLVDKSLSEAWAVTDPDQVLKARHDAVSAALHRVLGDPDLGEALAIMHRVCDGLGMHGRPLYAAHSALPWPEDDLLALWHAATLVREHRGDGHVSVLHAAGLDPVESLVLGGLFSHNTAFLESTRGWSPDEWAQARQRLREQGLLTADGELSERGRVVRRQIEQDTDALAVEGWARVSAADCGRLRDLVAPLRDLVLASDLLPDWASAAR